MPRKRPPGKTVEEREAQLVAAAVDLAEKQIMEGTASSQVITHFLKLGTAREKLEREKLAHENRLLIARTEAIDAAKETQELYREVLEALRAYSGDTDGEEDFD